MWEIDSTESDVKNEDLISEPQCITKQKAIENVVTLDDYEDMLQSNSDDNNSPKETSILVSGCLKADS